MLLSSRYSAILKRKEKKRKEKKRKEKKRKEKKRKEKKRKEKKRKENKQTNYVKKQFLPGLLINTMLKSSTNQDRCPRHVVFTWYGC